MKTNINSEPQDENQQVTKSDAQTKNYIPDYVQTKLKSKGAKTNYTFMNLVVNNPKRV